MQTRQFACSYCAVHSHTLSSAISRAWRYQKMPPLVLFAYYLTVSKSRFAPFATCCKPHVVVAVPPLLRSRLGHFGHDGAVTSFSSSPRVVPACAPRGGRVAVRLFDTSQCPICREWVARSGGAARPGPLPVAGPPSPTYNSHGQVLCRPVRTYAVTAWRWSGHQPIEWCFCGDRADASPTGRPATSLARVAFVTFVA